MMNMKTLVGGIALIAATLMACNNEENHENHDQGGMSQNAAATEMTPIDSVYGLVMDYHDEAMPKMGKLKGYQQDAQAKIDSLSSLNDAGSKKLKAEFEQLLANLQDAEKGMNDWMTDFKLQEEFDNKDSLMPYYSGEVVKAKLMRDNIFTVLDSAMAKIGPR